MVGIVLALLSDTEHQALNTNKLTHPRHRGQNKRFFTTSPSPRDQRVASLGLRPTAGVTSTPDSPAKPAGHTHTERDKGIGEDMTRLFHLSIA